MRNVRRIEPLHLTAADGKLFAIPESPGRPVGKVIERRQHTDFGSKRRRSRCDCQQVVQRSEFVAFKVRPANPAQLLDWHHSSYRFHRGGEYLPPSSVEEQRLIVINQV